MKKIAFNIVLLFSFLCANCQYIYFNKRYDINNQADVSRGIIEVDGGYIIAGGTDPTVVFSMFIDTLGNKKWSKTYQIPNWPWSYFGFAGSLINTKNNKIAICGGVVDNNDVDNSLLFLINDQGDTIWTKTYNTNNLDNTGRQCKQTTDGGFVICGDIAISGPSNVSDFLLIKTDSNGVIQWWKNYGDNKIEGAYNVIQTPDKDYLLGGIHYYNSGGNFHPDPKIVKTDSMGNFKWDKLMGGIYDDNAAMVCMAKDSNYIVAFTEAEYEISGYPYRRIEVNKLDTAGNVIWSKKYGPTYYNNNLTQIKLMADGGFLVCGFSDHPQFTFYQVGWMLRLNAEGDSIWYREYANSVQNNFFNELHDFYITKDSGIVATGPLYPNSTGGTQDIWVIKTDSYGCLDSNCDGVVIVEIKENIGMVIYPNPARDKMTFLLNQKDLSDLKLVIYNLQGQILLQKDLIQNNTEIDVSLLPQGIYVARVSFGNGSYTQKKFVVVK
jgi:hypothetical protein